jgi:hypothetical protein
MDALMALCDAAQVTVIRHDGGPLERSTPSVAMAVGCYSTQT